MFFILFAKIVKSNPVGDAIRLTLVYAMGGWCLFTILMTEALGVLNLINRAMIIALWSVALVVVALIIWRKQTLTDAFKQLSAWWRKIKLGTGERFLLAGISFYLVVLVPDRHNFSTQ